MNFCQRTERFPTARLSGQPRFPAGDVSSSESTRSSPAGASSGRGGARATIYKATEREIQGKATRGCCRPCSPPQNPLWSQTQGPKPRLRFGVSPSRPPPLWPLSPLSARIIKLPFFNPKWKQADGCAVPQIPQIRGGILHRAKDLSLMKTQSPVGDHKVPPAPEGTQLWSWPQFWG